MDVKSIFLDEYLNEEVFVQQSKGFFHSTFSHHVYKLKNVLYSRKKSCEKMEKQKQKYLFAILVIEERTYLNYVL